MRPRLPFLGPAGLAIAGIWWADNSTLPLLPLLGTTAALGLAALFRPRTWLFLLCVFVGFAARQTLVLQAPATAQIDRLTAAGSVVIEVAGLVDSPPQRLPFFAGKQTGSFELAVETLTVAGQAQPLPTRLKATWAGPLPQLGDRIRLRGTLRALDPKRNPGPFDFAAAQRRAGLVAQVEAHWPQDCEVLASGAGAALKIAADRARGWMQRQLALDLEDSPEIAGLIASMVLGLRSETPDEMKELFRKTGTLHLFAVSGLNIGMLAALLAFPLQLFLNRRAVPLLVIPILAGYAFVTGLSPSCVRAAIMGSLFLFAATIDRPALTLNNVAAAAVLLLAWDPQQLFAVGFQFSFVLVVAIVLLTKGCARPFSQLGQPDPFLPRPLWSRRQHGVAWTGRCVADTIGVTLAAWLASTPFTAGYFHLFSFASIAANFLAVPLAFFILALGVATVALGSWLQPVAVLCSNANWLCAKALLGLVETFAGVPAGHRYVEFPQPRPPVCEVQVLDVGSGSAVHVRAGAEDWLIDSGPTARYNGTTLPYLRSRGIDRLNALVLTHGDAQHIGAAAELLDDFSPGLLVDSAVRDRSSTRKALHARLAQENRGKAFARRGDRFRIGPAELIVLFPPVGWQRSSADDKTLVLRLDCAGRRILLMSDAGLTAERWLLDNEPDLRADIVIKGHHARDYSGTGDFLLRVQPHTIVVGPPAYGTPRESLDAWTAEAGQHAKVLRQDECGAVRIAIERGGIVAEPFLRPANLRPRLE